MKKHDYDTIKKRLNTTYQRAHRALLRSEKKNIDTPLPEIAMEVAEIRGFKRGLKRCIDLIEDRIQDVDLFKQGAQ